MTDKEGGDVEEIARDIAMEHGDYGYPCDDFHALVKAIASALRSERTAPSEPAGEAETAEEALRYATNLLTNIVEKRYPDRSPNWEPLPNLIGVLTQIDNVVSGLVRADGGRDMSSAQHRLVPVEPTEEMLAAGNAILNVTHLSPEVYRAMLAAAPRMNEKQEWPDDGITESNRIAWTSLNGEVFTLILAEAADGIAAKVVDEEGRVVCSLWSIKRR